MVEPDGVTGLVHDQLPACALPAVVGPGAEALGEGVGGVQDGESHGDSAPAGALGVVAVLVGHAAASGFVAALGHVDGLAGLGPGDDHLCVLGVGVVLGAG